MWVGSGGCFLDFTLGFWILVTGLVVFGSSGGLL